MAVHFSGSRERVTQATTSWSLAEWKSTQRKLSGACWAERGAAAASVAAIETERSQEETTRMYLGYRRERLDAAHTLGHPPRVHAYFSFPFILLRLRSALYELRRRSLVTKPCCPIPICDHLAEDNDQIL